jgi:integrase-like protein
MAAAEITQFLSALAVQRHMAASTRNQTLTALLFLYGHGLELLASFK